MNARASGGAALEAGRALQTEKVEPKAKPASWKRRLGFGLVALSCLLYGSLLLVPTTSLSTEGKVALSSLLVISGEASFWIGGLILGREAIRRWRGALHPRRWRRRGDEGGRYNRGEIF
ncbi:transporter suffix domain-containing protein [Methanocrinis sp.]|uniref:transporter suffix domain-containing protein n=1 Tax=Methanocrinis sp. TaxID=3101522 RepID=UPI003D134FAF